MPGGNRCGQSCPLVIGSQKPLEGDPRGNRAFVKQETQTFLRFWGYKLQKTCFVNWAAGRVKKRDKTFLFFSFVFYNPECRKKRLLNFTINGAPKWPVRLIAALQDKYS